MAAPQEVLAAGSAEPAPGRAAAEPTFLTTQSCPYAQRTWIALNARGLAFTPVLVDLNNKPEWFFQHNEYGRVPTLVWTQPDGSVASLYESLVCNEFIADLPGSGPALLPADAVARGRARLLIDQFGAKFGPAFGKAMFAADVKPGSQEATDLDAALAWVEGQLKAASPSGPLFLGADISLVDCAVAPFLLRLPLLQPLSGYQLPDASTLPRVHAYIAALEAHPAVLGSMQPRDVAAYRNVLLENYKAFVAKRRAATA